MRTSAFRLLAALIAATFLYASAAQAAGVHECPMHDARSTQGSSDVEQGFDHAHHGAAAGDAASGGSHGDHEGYCCCIDAGCFSSLFMLPSQPFGRWTATVLAQRGIAPPELRLVVTQSAHRLPFANGPPHTAEA